MTTEWKHSENHIEGIKELKKSWSYEESSAINAEAIESLLLLGREPILTSQRSNSESFRRYSSGSASDTNVNSTECRSDPGSLTYYQRMRERNNEASKRCRLKRRLKAEQIENQNNLLSRSNKLLKQRIFRLEKIIECLKEGTDQGLQENENGKLFCSCFETIAAIKKINRELPDRYCMSTNEILVDSRSRRELETPLLNDFLMTSSDEGENDYVKNVKNSFEAPSETMNKSLKNPLRCYSKKKSFSQTSQILLVDREEEEEEVVIKVEPELLQQTNCIVEISKQEFGNCSGDLLSLNKLKGSIDLVSRVRSRESGGTATEKSIIKSVLGLPFWLPDEAPSFICYSHRENIIFHPDFYNCAMCYKKRVKHTSLGPNSSFMMTITYRMSLEYHTSTGQILPIGSVICSSCKDRYLQGIDFGNSQYVSSDPSLEVQLSTSLNAKPNVVEIRSLLPLKNNSIHISVPPLVQKNLISSHKDNATNTQENIFTKITRLNDAINAINPNYKPIGFSITSIGSCSQNVLQDAVNATETAISTLMSVIAPGQESYIWETVKPKIDEKLSPSNNLSKLTWSLSD